MNNCAKMLDDAISTTALLLVTLARSCVCAVTISRLLLDCLKILDLEENFEILAIKWKKSSFSVKISKFLKNREYFEI